jgi:DNA-directed RNA polymerase subunit RPC12/RpoP
MPMAREVEIMEMECPFCGHKEFLKTKDEANNENGFCEGEFRDAWDCTSCGERIELELDYFVKEAKEFKYYTDNNDWEGLLRFCLSEEYDDLTLIFLAKYYLKKQEWEKAQKIAEVILKINPEDFDGEIIIKRIERKDRKIRINVTASQLIDAFQCCNLKKFYFLDLRTKELVSYTFDLDGVGEEQIKKDIEDNPQSFLKIPLKNSRENFHLQESFVHEIGEHQGQTKIAEVLSMTLKKNAVFRSFTETLLKYPKINEQWFKFERDVYKEIALDWVCENNLICRWEK